MGSAGGIVDAFPEHGVLVAAQLQQVREGNQWFGLGVLASTEATPVVTPVVLAAIAPNATVTLSSARTPISSQVVVSRGTGFGACVRELSAAAPSSAIPAMTARNAANHSTGESRSPQRIRTKQDAQARTTASIRPGRGPDRFPRRVGVVTSCPVGWPEIIASRLPPGMLCRPVSAVLIVWDLRAGIGDESPCGVGLPAAVYTAGRYGFWLRRA